MQFIRRNLQFGEKLCVLYFVEAIRELMERWIANKDALLCVMTPALWGIFRQ